MIYEEDGTITFESKADMAICLIGGLKVKAKYCGNILYFDDKYSNPFRYSNSPLNGAWNDLSGWTKINECSDFKEDDKVIVKYDDIYYKRHFAKCLNDKPYCYIEGVSSFTSGSIEGEIYLNEPDIVEVDFCVKATPENIKKYTKTKEKYYE